MEANNCPDRLTAMKALHWRVKGMIAELQPEVPLEHGKWNWTMSVQVINGWDPGEKQTHVTVFSPKNVGDEIYYELPIRGAAALLQQVGYNMTAKQVQQLVAKATLAPEVVLPIEQACEQWSKEELSLTIYGLLTQVVLLNFGKKARKMTKEAFAQKMGEMWREIQVASIEDYRKSQAAQTKDGNGASSEGVSP
jgi:hypothetical protein